MLAIPLATYFFSYLYLAVFHQKVWLWSTVIHESGTLTLLETTLYASHFLGHIPSLTIIAALFAVWFRIFSPTDEKIRFSWFWGGFAIVFILLCLVGSIAHFGVSETLAYLLLKQQSVTRSEPGGSFLLHLPSTLSLIVLLPWFFLGTFWLTGRSLNWNSRYANHIVAAPVVILALAFAVTGSLSDIAKSLSDPRYLAHSVRELATFPLTFFPIPLALWLSGTSDRRQTIHPAARGMLILTLLLALPFLTYPVWIPLTVGVSDLAQQPEFSTEPLPISYLLASHYFEHILDTVYFTLLCFTLIRPRGVNNS